MELKLNASWIWLCHPNEVLCVRRVEWVTNAFTAINEVLNHPTSLIVCRKDLEPISIWMINLFSASCWIWFINIVKIEIAVVKTKSFISTSRDLENDFYISLFNASTISATWLPNCKPMYFCFFPSFACQVRIIINVALPVACTWKIFVLVSHKNNFSVSFKPSSNSNCSASILYLNVRIILHLIVGRVFKRIWIIELPVCDCACSL